MPANHIFGYKSSGWVPNITGVIAQTYGTWRELSVSGAFATSGTIGTKARGESGSSTAAIDFDASRCSDVYNNSVTGIMAANLTMLFIIKY